MAETVEGSAPPVNVRGLGRDGILILDSERGTILEIDPFLAGLLGCSRGELIGRSPGEIGVFMEPAQIEAIVEWVRRDAYVLCDEVRVKTRDGRCAPVEVIGNSYVADGRKMIQLHVCEIPEHARAGDGVPSPRRMPEIP
jgi:PAS domain S-box-containing protein